MFGVHRRYRREAGSGGAPRNNNSQQQYPNLLKECEVLTPTPGQDRWGGSLTFKHVRRRDLPVAGAHPAGLIDITRFWFEQGSLRNERKVADFLKYKVESRTSRASIRCEHADDANGACGVASDAAGVVGCGSTRRARHRRLRSGHQADGC